MPDHSDCSCYLLADAADRPLLRALDEYGPLTTGELASLFGTSAEEIDRSMVRLRGMGLVMDIDLRSS